MKLGSSDRNAEAEEYLPSLDRRSALKSVGVLAAAALPFKTSASAQAANAPPAAPAAATERNITATLAEYAAATSFEKIPADVRERAKKIIFDEIASSYFGRRTDAGKMAAQYATRFGGAPEARIYGTALRAPAHYAALANGTAGHGEEVDGTHVVGGHPGAAIVHAATAIAEKHRVSGAELINAVVLGYEVGVRLVAACGGVFKIRERFQVHSDFMYGLGATTAVSRILRLNADRHRHALALATFQVNGLSALFAERRHISKSFCNGQYAFAGVSSAWMAEMGMEGHDDIIGADAGVLAAWGDKDQRQVLTDRLGTDFKIMGANFKFYNAGQPIHTSLEASTALVKQHNIAVDSIQSILIGLPSNTLQVVDARAMSNISVQDMVAANLVTGGIKIGDEPFPGILNDPAYKRLRPFVSAQVDPDLEREFPNGRGGRVTITTRSGARHSLRIDAPRGYSTRGETSWDDLAEKWTGVLRGADVGKALATARRVEQLKDANELFSAFAGIHT